MVGRAADLTKEENKSVISRGSGKLISSEEPTGMKAEA
jgi:hypothetical protein